MSIKLLFLLPVIGRHVNSFEIRSSGWWGRTFPLQKSTTTSQKFASTSAASRDTHSTCILQMVLTPIGPFCPFRSSASMDLERRIEKLSSKTINSRTAVAARRASTMITPMTNGTSEFNTGVTILPLSPSRSESFEDYLDDAMQQWEELKLDFKQSPDFQTTEYAKLIDVHDAKLIDVHEKSHGNSADSMTAPEHALEPFQLALLAANAVTVRPFGLTSFQSQIITDEYTQLVWDHSQLIDSGANYGDFDPHQKLSHLMEIEKLEERWDAVFFRFKLMDAINSDYKKQCDQFLANMNMKEEGFRQLLKKSHEIMRRDAEEERDSFQ